MAKDPELGRRGRAHGQLMTGTGSEVPVNGSRAQDFFIDLVRRSRAALARDCSSHADIVLAGFPVRLQFASPEIRSALWPAFAHRCSNARAEPALEIMIWDSASTGVESPQPAWQHDDYRERGLIRGFNTDRFRTCFQIGPDTLSMLDVGSGLGVQWVRDAEALPYYEKGAPLRHLFNWWMSENGHMLVHAAAVCLGDRAGLLVGKGGSGKSTTAIACLGTNLRYISDDYCLVGPADAPNVHSLYSTAKLTRDSLARFPDLERSINKTKIIADDKLLFFLHPTYKQLMTSGARLEAIYVPVIDPKISKSEIEPVSRAKALLALAPSSIFQLSGGGSNEFGILSDLVERVSCYRLRLGSDPTEAAEAIYQHLSGDGR